MTEQWRKAIMFAVLGVAVVFGVVMRPWERRSIMPPIEPPSLELAATTPAAVVPIQSNGYALHASLEWPSDPFVRPEDRRVEWKQPSASVSSEPAPPPVALQGIMRTGSSMSCVINGQSIGVGGRIDGWIVHEIGSDVVALSFNGRLYNVRLGRR